MYTTAASTTSRTTTITAVTSITATTTTAGSTSEHCSSLEVKRDGEERVGRDLCPAWQAVHVLWLSYVGYFFICVA